MTTLITAAKETIGRDNLRYPSISFNSIETNKVDMRYENASSF